jgi:hypothetical protein
MSYEYGVEWSSVEEPNTLAPLFNNLMIDEQTCVL